MSLFNLKTASRSFSLNFSFLLNKGLNYFRSNTLTVFSNNSGTHTQLQVFSFNGITLFAKRMLILCCKNCRRFKELLEKPPTDELSNGCY